MGLLLAIDRRIADNVADLRAGRWDKKSYGKADGLLGSDDGHRRARLDRARASRSGPRRSASRCRRWHKPGTQPVRRGPRRPSSASPCATRSTDLLAHLRHRLPARARRPPRPSDLVDADVPRVNAARRDPAQHLARRRRRRGGPAARPSTPGRCGPGSTCTPTSRAAARPSGPPRSPSTPDVVGTHHIGASTEQAQRATADGVVEIVDAFVAGEARNCVNLAPSRLGSVDADRPPPRPGRRARAGPRPAERGRPQRRAHGEPGVPRAARRRSPPSTSPAPCPTGCSTTSAAIPHVLGVSRRCSPPGDMAPPYEAAGPE